MSRPTIIGIRHDVLALAREGKWQPDIAGHMGLTHATGNRILQRHAATGTLVPGKSTGLLGRPHLLKTVLCWGWLDRIASSALRPWRHGRGFFVEWVLTGKPSTTSSFPVVTMPIDIQRSPYWLPTNVVLLWVGTEVALYLIFPTLSHDRDQPISLAQPEACPQRIKRPLCTCSPHRSRNIYPEWAQLI